MKTRTYHASGSRALMAGTALLVVAGTLVSTAFNPFAAARRARLAEALNNARQIKFACDSFATDFDGRYPNVATGRKLTKDGTGDKFSNDFFQQLFLAGETQSEVIFWVKNASVCTKKKPDDIVTRDGKPHLPEILQAGDCGWAYMTGQTNTSNVARPLIIDAFKAGTKDFDHKIWDRKAIVLRIDGSVKPMRMRDADKKVVDGSNNDILSPEADAWDGSGENPAELLKQPNPKPVADADADAVKLPPAPKAAPAPAPKENE